MYIPDVARFFSPIRVKAVLSLLALVVVNARATFLRVLSRKLL